MAGIGAMGDLARVNTNVGATNAYNHLKSKNKAIQQHQEHLATGQRVNRASDSPANYVISRKMQSKANSLASAQENIGDAMAAMQEADTALSQIDDIILDMKSLAQQAASDTVGGAERKAIEYEIQQYASEITDIAEDTNWQGNSLLDGDLDWTFQVGEKTEDTIKFSLSSSKDENKGFSAADLDLTDLKSANAEEATATWEKLNKASENILETEEVIGAVINRMDLKSEALSSAETNTQAAISRIRDADIAQEQMSLAKENILQQISLVMLGQSGQAPGAFMTLFR
ncbi:MAG: flagellin [Candidatus Zixiibacteriota bacterium]